MTQEDKIEFKLMFIEVLKDGNFVTKEDLKNLATKDDIARLEDRMDKLEDRIDRLEGYVHEEFLLIENEMMPKINAMYEALTTRVSHVECNDRMEVIEGKTDAITPLLITVKKNTTKLREHEERIKSLEAPA